MTKCTGGPAEQYLEDYLQGTLPEDEATTFEEHYFECAVCLARLEALQEVQRHLRIQPQLASRKPIPWRVRFTMVAAIAAALIAVVFAFSSGRRQAQSAIALHPTSQSQQSVPAASKLPSLATRTTQQLADLALPAFRRPSLRGQSMNAHFEAGMRAYVSRDCARALKSLSRVPAKDDASVAARFYTGVCKMHEGDLQGAKRSLRGVADFGDSPQQEAAFYYLAQIALAGNDAVTARRYLGKTISLHGDLQSPARAQLAHMPSSDAGQ